jgi:hypothetical protein
MSETDLIVNTRTPGANRPEPSYQSDRRFGRIELEMEDQQAGADNDSGNPQGDVGSTASAVDPFNDHLE